MGLYETVINFINKETPMTDKVFNPPPSGGQKFDGGKIRIELFPGDALFAISSVLTKGAVKYTARNWELGIGWGRVFGATMRHLWAWWQGRGPTNKNFLFGNLDAETGFSHLWHAGACIVFLIAYEMRGMWSFDDRPRVSALAYETPTDFQEHGGELGRTNPPQKSATWLNKPGIPASYEDRPFAPHSVTSAQKAANDASRFDPEGGIPGRGNGPMDDGRH